MVRREWLKFDKLKIQLQKYFLYCMTGCMTRGWAWKFVNVTSRQENLLSPLEVWQENLSARKGDFWLKMCIFIRLDRKQGEFSILTRGVGKKIY